MLIYKYTRLSNLISTLENGIFASSPRDMNDPYEIMGFDTEGLRICCLSRSRNKKLMWSHYADGHRGCSIGIEVPEDFGKESCILQDVKYKRLSECIAISDPVERLRFKDPKWNDEREVRAVFNENDNDPELWRRKRGKVYLKVKIKEVAFGNSVDLTDSDFIASLLWIKRYNDQQKRKEDKIKVAKYKALTDRYRFEKDKDFDYEEVLSKYPNSI